MKDNKRIYAFSGHRLSGLPCKYNHKHPWKLEKLGMFEDYLISRKDEIDYVISGMALGADVWGAFMANRVGIPFHAYIPCLNQERLWAEDHKKQYHKLLDKSDKIVYTSTGEYQAWKMFKRDEDMVNAANEVLALWDTTKRSGGTWHTIAYAMSKGKPITNFWGLRPYVIEKERLSWIPT